MKHTSIQASVDTGYFRDHPSYLPSLSASLNRRAVMAYWLITSDLLVLGAAAGVAIFFITWITGDSHNPVHYLRLAPLLVFFPLAYAINGLYPGIGITPVEEIRRLTNTTSGVFALVATIISFTRTEGAYSLLVFLLFWLISLALTPIGRLVFRRLGLVLGIWGEPVALIGFGPRGKKVLDYLRKNRLSGFIPVVVVSGLEKQETGDYQDAQLLKIKAESLARDPKLLSRTGLQTAILVPDELPPVLRAAILDEHQFGLRRLIWISNLNWIGGPTVVPYDLQGILGLEVECKLLNPVDRLLKRLLDLALLLIACMVGLPLILLCGLLIRVDSPGPVFYRQRRVGWNGEEIRVWKFRTMVQNADQVLDDCLSCDETRRAEWEATHKLKDDPRVTRVGKVLRRTSLDELPQLINVLCGEMSLVGPRPIVAEEIHHYAEIYRLYIRVLPGITGLWQVSGRSNTSYPNRVALDKYYIRHWSIWLDIYILLRTIPVVLRREGAY